VIARRAARALAGPLALLALCTLPGASAEPQPQAPAQPLSGRDIYARVISKRFRSFSEESRLISADRSGREQETRLRLHWKDFRDGNGVPTDGILSKAVVRYTHPTDIRYAGYLVQSNAERTNDQFIYYPSKRRVVRVNLRNEAVHGTDFSFEDVVPRELEDARYERRADATFGEIPVFVVELVPRPKAGSEYSKVWVYVDQQRFVPLRTRYWDAAGVETKELSADPASLRRFENVWIPMQTTMRNLQLETWTRLEITDFVANPELAEAVFDLARLESH
jgi:outer membrane lipoprotein-sorting protein